MTGDVPVQEIASRTDGVPEEYLQNNVNIDASVPRTSCPIVDHNLLFSISPTERDQELRKLRLALSSWGCFQLINHNMTFSFLDEVRGVTKQFFSLPLEEKGRYSTPVNDYEGYGNDNLKNKNLDWMDRLYLLAYPEEKRRLQFWIEYPMSFRPLLHEFSIKSQVVLELVFKAMAQSLNLQDDCFLKQYGAGKMLARFNLYPRSPLPDRTIGLKQHTDGSAVTIILQDNEVEGLQVLRDEQWFRVPIVPNALFINSGDQMEIMSNGIFKSPVHRVLTNSERDRISVAMFATPDPESVIGPVDQLISKNRPQMYRKLKNYPLIFVHYHRLGKTPIEAIKI